MGSETGAGHSRLSGQTLNRTCAHFSNCSDQSVRGSAPTPTHRSTPNIELQYASDLAQDFVSIVAPFIMIIGVIGNILLYFVFPKCSFAARLETRLYIRALAITDIVVMIGLLRKWLHALKHLDFATSSVVACKATNMVCYVATHFAVWLVVAITAERCQTILWPRRPTTNRYRHHAAVLFVLAVVSVLLNMHHVFDTTVVLEVHDESGINYYDWEEYHSQKMDPSKTLSYCSMDRKTSSDLMFSLWTVVDGVAYTVVPSLLIIAMNVLIVIRLVRVAKYAKHNAHMSRLSLSASGFNTVRSQQCLSQPATLPGLNGDHVVPLLNTETRRSTHEEISRSRTSETESEAGNRIVNREREVTVMLVIFSIAFVIMTAPYCIITAMSNMKFIIGGLPYNESFLPDNESLPQGTSEGSPIEVWVGNIAEMLMYTQHACQFYLYLCGRNFRKLVGYALCAPPAITSLEVNELADPSRRQRQLSDFEDELFADLNLAKVQSKNQGSAKHVTVTIDRRSSNDLQCLADCYPDGPAYHNLQLDAAQVTRSTLTNPKMNGDSGNDPASH